MKHYVVVEDGNLARLLGKVAENYQQLQMLMQDIPVQLCGMTHRLAFGIGLLHREHLEKHLNVQQYEALAIQIAADAIVVTAMNTFLENNNGK